MQSTAIAAGVVHKCCVCAYILALTMPSTAATTTGGAATTAAATTAGAAIATATAMARPAA